MEKTTFISANGEPYERAVPKICITTFINDVALENIRKQSGVNFQKDMWNNICGQPETWEQFAKVLMTYNWLTHSQNNWDGNIMYLRADCNTPRNACLFYQKDGQKFLEVDT